MQDQEFEKRFREFMNREMPGETYHVMIAHTDGRIGKDSGIQVKTQIIGFDTRVVPFAVAHSIFRALEASLQGMLQGTYGSAMKPTSAKPVQEESNMHL